MMPPNTIRPSFIEPTIRVTEVSCKCQQTFNTLTKVYLVKIPGSYYENADAKQLRMVAGEGVFRFENYCFFRDMKNWLHWAIYYWVKEYFYGSNPRALERRGTLIAR